MRARGREACDFGRGGVIELPLSFTGNKTLEELAYFSWLSLFVIRFARKFLPWLPV